MSPQVLMVLWVSYNTVADMVQCVPVPTTGMVCAGMGTGLNFPTVGNPFPTLST